MIIKSITLGNFKGFQKPTKINLKPITLLYGENSAGKSSIIQAMSYLKSIIVDGEYDPCASTDPSIKILGEFSNLKNVFSDDPLMIAVEMELEKSNDFVNNIYYEAESGVTFLGQSFGKSILDKISSFQIEYEFQEYNNVVHMEKCSVRLNGYHIPVLEFVRRGVFINIFDPVLIEHRNILKDLFDREVISGTPPPKIRIRESDEAIPEITSEEFFESIGLTLEDEPIIYGHRYQLACEMFDPQEFNPQMFDSQTWRTDVTFLRFEGMGNPDLFIEKYYNQSIASHY